MVDLPDGSIGILHERDEYSEITFSRFSLAWAVDGDARPEILTPDTLEALVDVPLSFSPRAHDPGEPSLTWHFPDLPAWLRVSGDCLVGQPTVEDAPTKFHIIANANGLQDTATVIVHVSTPLSAPESGESSPAMVQLFPNAPDSFNLSAIIEFEFSTAGRTVLIINDL